MPRLHEEAVRRWIDSPIATADLLTESESTVDRGIEIPQGALMPFRLRIVLYEGRDIIIDLYERLSDWEVAHNKHPLGADFRNADHNLIISSRFQTGPIGGLLFLIRNKDVDFLGGNLIFGQGCQSLPFESLDSLIGGYRDHIVGRLTSPTHPIQDNVYFMCFQILEE